MRVSGVSLASSPTTMCDWACIRFATTTKVLAGRPGYGVIGGKGRRILLCAVAVVFSRCDRAIGDYSKCAALVTPGHSPVAAARPTSTTPYLILAMRLDASGGTRHRTTCQTVSLTHLYLQQYGQYSYRRSAPAECPKGILRALCNKSIRRARLPQLTATNLRSACAHKNFSSLQSL